MAQLEPQAQRPFLPNEATTRQLADLAALLERGTGLGLCLRRSLLRYHYLRQLHLPLTIQFGAKFIGNKDDRAITGHAWLTHNGRPYHEDEANWRDFTVMLSWPPLSKQ